MSQIHQHNLYELDILRHVERTPRLNNRMAAKKLGVSVKLAHQVLKRMVKKGLLHVAEINSRRWEYFLTPKGIAEKTRLTVEFLDFSMRFYREARRRSAELCRELAEAGKTDVAFLGAGELAEIVYLGVQEWGLELAAVFDDNGPERFMNMPVQLVDELAGSKTDAVIVCLYDVREPMGRHYLPSEVENQPNMRWVFDKE
jgi:DNA-binding MarR family transcriptional regulator